MSACTIELRHECVGLEGRKGGHGEGDITRLPILPLILWRQSGEQLLNLLQI